MIAKALLVGVLAAFAAAQGTSSTLSFTRVPIPITAGQQQALLYATSNSNAPVTILLKKGNPNDLDTVATLTTTATNGQYIWTPELSLENGSDYALEIKQGDQLNYYGPFQIQGGGKSSSSSSSSSSGSATASMSSTHSGSSSAIVTIAASQNATAITTATISSGTGMSMPRNTTMSSATLSRTSSEASATTSASRSSNGAGFQGSKTSASAPANTGAASSLIVTGSSAIALAFGAVAAVFFC